MIKAFSPLSEPSHVRKQTVSKIDSHLCEYIIIRPRGNKLSTVYIIVFSGTAYITEVYIWDRECLHLIVSPRRSDNYFRFRWSDAVQSGSRDGTNSPERTDTLVTWKAPKTVTQLSINLALSDCNCVPFFTSPSYGVRNLPNGRRSV